MSILKTALALVLGGMLGLAWVTAAMAEEETADAHRFRNCPADAINVVDANGQCVGRLLEVDPTVVARRFGDQVYAIEVTVRQGIKRGLATFLYPTADCSGTAYMEDDDNLPQALWADTAGVLWTAGTAPPGGTINVHSTRSLPPPSCNPLNQPSVLVGEATAIDSSLAISLAPPFAVPKLH